MILILKILKNCQALKKHILKSILVRIFEIKQNHYKSYFDNKHLHEKIKEALFKGALL